MSELADITWRLITAATGQSERSRDTDCLYFAAAVKAVLPGWRFAAGGAFLPSSGMTGWGLSVSPRDQTYYVTADAMVDADDGSYCGHCWVEAGPKWSTTIVDVMSDYYGMRTCFEPLVVYHRIPSLARSIQHYHRTKLTRVIKAARKDVGFVRLIQDVATKALEITAV